jgi:hypothetical protein
MVKRPLRTASDALGAIALAAMIGVSAAAAGAGDPPAAPVTVEMDAIAELPAATLIGGRADRATCLRLNLPLLRRLLVSPDDLVGATLEIDLAAGAKVMDVLAEGRGGNGDKIDLARQGGLGRVALAAVISSASQFHPNDASITTSSPDGHSARRRRKTARSR